MARRRRSACTALAVACVGLFAASGPAAAVPVPWSTTLVDGAGNSWTQLAGQVVAAPAGAGAAAALAQAGLNPSSPAFVATTPASCEEQLGGRQLSGPAQTAGPFVTVARTLYVPADTPAFARVIDTWKNLSGRNITIEPLEGTSISSGATRWRQTSSGDAVPTPDDDWVILADTAPGVTPTLPVAAEIWSGPGATRRVAALDALSLPPSPWVDGDAIHLTAFQPVTIPVGGSRALMSVYLTRPAGDAGLNSAQADAAAISTNPERLFTGVSAAGQESILNWGSIDGDGDGIGRPTDNCPAVANPDQRDTDGDGQGDACDTDDDGDGVPDAIEALLGTDSLRSDSDGDGKVDTADACPKVAAATTDGCPAANVQGTGGGKTADTTAPACAIGGVKKTVKRKAFLKGIVATVTCDERTAVEGSLLGSARSVRLTAAFNLTLGARSLALGGGARKLTIKPSKRLVGKAKKLTVQLLVVATDASGNRTRKTQTIKIH
jgi:hypothetical protein